jgi:hypothetical protein
MLRPLSCAVLMALPIAASAMAPAASSRCIPEAGNCRDMNAGTLATGGNQAGQAKKKTTTPRDAGSGQATGKRMHKPGR